MTRHDSDAIQRDLLRRLRADARRLAWVFGLKLKGVEPESPRAKMRMGCCAPDGTLYIALKTKDGRRFMAYRTLLATLCHELAHLKDHTHGEKFKSLHKRIRYVAFTSASAKSV